MGRKLNNTYVVIILLPPCTILNLKMPLVAILRMFSWFICFSERVGFREKESWDWTHVLSNKIPNLTTRFQFLLLSGKKGSIETNQRKWFLAKKRKKEKKCRKSFLWGSEVSSGDKVKWQFQSEIETSLEKKKIESEACVADDIYDCNLQVCNLLVLYWFLTFKLVRQSEPCFNYNAWEASLKKKTYNCTTGYIVSLEVVSPYSKLYFFAVVK